MNLKLKPRVFLMGFLPGFLFICGIVLTYKQFDVHQILVTSEKITIIIGIAIIVLSFIIGQVFDSCRDWLVEDNIADRWKKVNRKDINWDFFFTASDKKIDKLDNNYYLFYVLNLDLSICLASLILSIIGNFLLMICSMVECNRMVIFKSILFVVIYVLSILFLFKDALILRSEIALHTNKNTDEKASPSH